jgi:hypothetical protein
MTTEEWNAANPIGTPRRPEVWRGTSATAGRS